MGWCMAAISPLLMHWRYHCLAQSHRYNLHSLHGPIYLLPWPSLMKTWDNGRYIPIYLWRWLSFMNIWDNGELFRKAIFVLSVSMTVAINPDGGLLGVSSTVGYYRQVIGSTSIWIFWDLVHFHTGPLCREFTGHRWIPLTKASDAELWWFHWSGPE